MGLIRDALGSAMGANQVNNGFGGLGGSTRKSAVLSGFSSSRRSPAYDDYDSRNQNRYQNQNQPSRRQDYAPAMGGGGTDVWQDRGDQPPMEKPPPYQAQQLRENGDGDGYGDRDPYSQPSRQNPSPFDDRRSWNQGQQQQQSYDGPYDERSYHNLGNIRNVGYARNSAFRPLALPQVEYGDGKPFLRGYSDDLGQYGIAPDDFIRVLDAINVAIIPSPENQIFQKGANIAGWFLPGAASIGLMVGQLGVGMGSAVGHASMLSRALSNANLRLFVPNGLELCIGKATDVAAEVGIAPASGRSDSSYGLSPEQRIAYYGNLLAPLSRVLPPLPQSGRRDPVAMLGHGLASRDSQKKMQKAEKNTAKGKSKDSDSLEGALKWLIVRRASADALAYWERSMQESNSAIQQQQEQGRTSSQSGYSRQ